MQAQNSYELSSTCTSSCTCPYTVLLAHNTSVYDCYILIAINQAFQFQVKGV